MTGALRFDKYEGLGNDFIVVESSAPSSISPEAARALCDRRFGVGADGVLLVLPPSRRDCDAAMRVVNADGSIPEMCGNGLRCVALHLARRAGQSRVTLRVETDAGVRVCDVERAPDRAIVTVDMGLVRVGEERSIDVAGEAASFVPADAGNPHAVLLGAFDPSAIARLGPRLAIDPSFPSGTNVEFANVASGGIDLVVWERGVGLTLACGTGACAAAAVACARGAFGHDVPIDVRLPGGALTVTIARDGRAILRGPAAHVFSGVAGAASA